jgi:hypothetical protein
MIRSLILAVAVSGLTFITMGDANAQHYGQRSSGFGISLNYGTPHGYSRSRYNSGCGSGRPNQSRAYQRFLPTRYTSPNYLSTRSYGAYSSPRYGGGYGGSGYCGRIGCGYGGGYGRR